MKQIELDARKVFPFQQEVEVSRAMLDMLEYVQRNGWGDIKRVPVFEIPHKWREEGFEYVLADGNHRREIAVFLSRLLPCALYEPEELIDTARDNLVPFRHSQDPKLLKRLWGFYYYRHKLPELARLAGIEI